MIRRLTAYALMMLVPLMAGAGPALAVGGLVFSGDYLQVGVSNSGGLIDDSFTTGIRFDCTGTGNYTAADYLKPGTPFEFYSVGVGGTYQTAGYYSGNNFGAATIQGDARLSTQTFLIYNSSLAINQSLYFQQQGNTIYFDIWGINLSDAILSNVVYARGLDPDQDSYRSTSPYTSASTQNSITGSTVRALGPYTGLYIEITDLTGGGVPSVDRYWDANPYHLLVPHNDGNGDYTINMAWNIGDLAPGQTFDLSFAYVLSDLLPPLGHPVPTPAAWLLMGSGLAALVGLRRCRPRQ